MRIPPVMPNDECAVKMALQTCMDNDLSKFEKNVVELYIEGLSYAEIGERLQKPVKSIDNAIQRIRNKILNQLQA